MKKYVKFTSHNGFTLLEVLLSMLVISVGIVMLVPCVRIMSELTRQSYASEDAIAVTQLRIMLAQSEEIQIQGDALIFNLNGVEQTLSLHQRRLVKQKGFVIYLKDLEDVRFVQEGGCIRVNWTRKQKEKDALLVCE